MARTMTIQIKSFGEALKDFRRTYKAVRAGKPVRRREGVYFTNLEAARRLLTPNRLALLRTIRQKRPQSIYQLAQLVGRDMKNVQEDLRLLEEYELVALTRTRSRGNRQARIPEVPFGEIQVKIAI